MKTFITILLLAMAMVFLFLFAFDKSFDDRCDYWESLPYPTETMKSLCPEHFEIVEWSFEKN